MCEMQEGQFWKINHIWSHSMRVFWSANEHVNVYDLVLSTILLDRAVNVPINYMLSSIFQ